MNSGERKSLSLVMNEKFEFIAAFITFHCFDVPIKVCRIHLLSYDAHEVEESLDNTTEHCKSVSYLSPLNVFYVTLIFNLKILPSETSYEFAR